MAQVTQYGAVVKPRPAVSGGQLGVQERMQVGRIVHHWVLVVILCWAQELCTVGLVRLCVDS